MTKQKSESKKQKCFLFVFLLSAFCLLLCRRPAQRPNVLLVTLDTFRADRVTARTPTLLRLAGSGRWYRQADSAVPLTLPAHATILSGLLPLHHGLRNNGIGSFPDRDTLATVFSRAGYRTGAFVSAFVLDRRFGLNRGFEMYDDEVPRDPNDAAVTFEAERRGGETVDRALQWLRHTDPRPWFAWVHLYDAHAPYAPPAPYAPSYDGEVEYVDAQVARLLANIDVKNTIIVIVGDHGESLGEHGELTHGLLLYEPALHVPFIVSGPGVERREVQQPVSTAEVAPIISALAHVEFPKLVHLPPDIYSETQYPATFGWSALTAVRNGDVKLIHGARTEMFDVRRDPGETHNLPIDRRMFARLQQVVSTAAPASTTTIDAETRSKLASLGYIAPVSNASASNRDPRDMAPLFRRFEEARGSIPVLEQLTREDPANSVFRSALAKAYRQAGNLDRAIALYREAVALAPGDADAWYNLATALQEGGRAGEAQKVAAEAAKLDPNRPDIHNVTGVALVESGNPSAAESEFRKAIELDPRNARAWNNLGNVLRLGGHAQEAQGAYRKALEISPGYADALNGLGVIAVQEGRAAEAIADFDAALQTAPDYYEAQLNRAIARQLGGNPDGAEDDLRSLLKRLPAGYQHDAQRQAARTLLTRLESLPRRR